MTNEQLIRQYYDGDEAALEKLYHKNHRSDPRHRQGNRGGVQLPDDGFSIIQISFPRIRKRFWMTSAARARWSF